MKLLEVMPKRTHFLHSMIEIGISKNGMLEVFKRSKRKKLVLASLDPRIYNIKLSAMIFNAEETIVVKNSREKNILFKKLKFEC